MKWAPLGVVACTALIAFCAAGLFGRAPKVTGESKNAPFTEPTASTLLTVGVGGCASAGCHGGPASASLAGKLDDRTWTGSATHWLAVDPHTKAYAALESPLAAGMKRMHSDDAATEDVRCLACHTNPSLANSKVDAREERLRADGVSCEACHGDAGRWVSRHASWTAPNRASEYERHGMAKLYDVGERALMCAGCHVGAPADPIRGYPVRDMNHDMIAAGHPRLNFDFADYQRRLPPHWLEEDRSPEFEVKAWLFGRVAQVEAARVLEEDREKRAKANDPRTRTPWPEFSDGKCVSCHHRVGNGYPGSTGKLQRPSRWPFREQPAMLVMLISTGAECESFLATALKSAPVNENDRDTAGQVYHALAARERSRMKREGRTTYDPAFDRIAKSLTLPRGNLDFTVKKETLDDLQKLLNP